MSDLNYNVLGVKPIVREAAGMNNDGGGGNLGYMQQNRDRNKEQKHKFDESIFGKKEEDIFISGNKVKYAEGESSFLTTVVDFLKKLLNM